MNLKLDRVKLASLPIVTVGTTITCAACGGFHDLYQHPEQEHILLFACREEQHLGAIMQRLVAHLDLDTLAYEGEN